MKVLLVATSLLASTEATTSSSDSYSSVPVPLTKVAVMCFSKGEQTSGLNKICYYDCVGSTVAINVESYELCPITINR